MTSATGTASRRLRRLMPTALIAATASLFIGTFAEPAIASAVWNVTAFDDCVKNAMLEDDDVDPDIVLIINCCLDSGGVWVEGEGICKARAPEIERPSQPRVGPPAQTSAPFSR
jgi:hypothetical protein